MAKLQQFQERLQELMDEFGVLAMTGTYGGMELEVEVPGTSTSIPIFMPNISAGIEVEGSR